MNLFLAVYPWLVLLIGLTNAAISIAGGAVIAFWVMSEKQDVSDLATRVYLAAFAFVVSNAVAVGILSITRWLLS